MKRFMEGATLISALVMFAAVEVSILCGIAGLGAVAVLCLEINEWE